MRSITTAGLLAGLVCAAPVFGADATAGKAAFHANCALCHSAEPGDNGGAQGPNLNGVFGRHAASTDFGYTPALKASGLTWDAATLNRFLTSPTTVVPGSAMVVPVADDTDRANIIAYFRAVGDGTFKPATANLAGGGAPNFGPPPGTPGQDKPIRGSDDWKKDVPGRVHRIRLATLPPAYDTPSTAKFPKLVPQPTDAQVKLPPGFTFSVFATDTTGARKMLLAPNGDIFLSETNASKVVVMRPSADGTHAEKIFTFAQGLNLPHGLAFFPNARNPQWLYVAETNRVVRYAYKTGDTQASGVPEIVVAKLSPIAGGGHFSRDVVFSPDNKKMYVSVGSASNVAEDLPKKSPEEIKAWEAQHGLGAAWGTEENRADVLVYDVGSDQGKVYASGIRNCVSLTVQPGNGALWCTTNERDMLGDDLVPDYSTRVKPGQWYGWPWYYMGNHEDPRHAGERPDLAGKVTSPDVPYQAHSAALNLTFYTAKSGDSAFPKKYVGDGFAVLHGSWNRAFRTGHKVVRVRMKNGEPTGEYDDFLTGFIVDDGNAWGRPVALLVNKDGSLLLTDDGANIVYRIAYAHKTKD